jgi:hypothetical protein
MSTPTYNGHGRILVSGIASNSSYASSPYLIMPGDNIVLSLSKTRPCLRVNANAGYWGDDVTGEFNSTSLHGHDVQIPSGTIRITLYGSYLKENNEFHDVHDDKLDSNSVYDTIIGNEPVVDQFDIAYKMERSGSYYDDVVTGFYVKKSKGNVILGDFGKDERSKKYGNLSTLHNVTTPLFGTFPIATPTTSSTYTINQWLTPLYTLLGKKYPGERHFSYDERLWDSMTPAVDDILLADKASIVGVTQYPNPIRGYEASIRHHIYMYHSSVTKISSSYYNNPLKGVGYLVLDIAGNMGNLDKEDRWFYHENDTGLPSFSDNHWTKSFPFESRFSNLNRYVQPKTTLETTLIDFDATINDQPAPLLYQPNYWETTQIFPATQVNMSLLQTMFVGFVPNELAKLPVNPGKMWLLTSSNGYGLNTQNMHFMDATKEAHLFILSDSNVIPNSSSFAAGLLSTGMTRHDIISNYYVHNMLPYNVAYEASNFDTEPPPDGFPAHVFPPDINEFMKFFFGFGDLKTYIDPGAKWSNGGAGCQNMPSFRFLTQHPIAEGSFVKTDTAFNNVYPQATGTIHAFSTVIRGWKYGLINALPEYSNAVFRRDSFGQFRDMLEQRLYTKFYSELSDNNSGKNSIQNSAITVNFVDKTTGNTTSAYNTDSSNLSNECTSSIPYFDGIVRNRK